MKPNHKQKIRKMDIKDVRFVHQFEQETFGKSFGKAMLYDEIIHNDMAHYAMMTLNQQRIGYIGMRKLPKGAEITTIAVIKSMRRHGVGTTLLAYGETICEAWGLNTITLEVRPSNKAAIDFYKAHGFKKCATRKHYYADGEDAWLMVKQVGGNKDDCFGS